MFLPLEIEHLRDVREGLYAFARPHLPWGFATHRSRDPERLRDPYFQHVHGAVASMSRDMIEAWTRYVGKPLVLFGPVADPAYPWVGVDQKVAGRLSADHLIGCGFQVLGYYRRADTEPQPAWIDGFESAARAAGVRVSHYDPAAQYPDTPIPADTGLNFDPHVYTWLRSMPEPGAVCCADDRSALQIAEFCRRTDIRVPEQLAVLGAGDDDMSCRLAYPPVSAIKLPGHKIGYEAARLLNQWLATGCNPRTHVCLAPSALVARQSTDTVAAADSKVAAAMRFIRDHAHTGITVEDAVEAVRISRRDLERRFRRVLRVSPYAMILRVRLDHARRLLADTDRTILDIATACGFSDAGRLTIAFRKAFDEAPGQYRKRYRLR